jgi:hypothetical protein
MKLRHFKSDSRNEGKRSSRYFYDKLSSILEILAQNQAVPISSFDESPNEQQSVREFNKYVYTN